MPDTPHPPKITITSRTTVHSPHPPAAEPLSITASNATMWPVTPVTLLYPHTALNQPLLTAALEHVVSAYPILGARLTTTPPSSGWPPHSTRYARAWAHTGPDEPGATLIFATWAGSIAEVLPSPVNGNPRVLDVLAASANELCDAGQIVVLRADGVAHPGAPLALQVTRFNDGVAVALRAHHSILDAHSAAHVLGAWLSTYAALRSGSTPPVLAGTFDRTPIDSTAGAIDTPDPDPTLLALADTIPGLRLDMARDTALALPLVALDPAPGAPETEGPSPPWSTWDWASHGSVQQRVLRFSAEEVAHLKVQAGGSRLDALVALVWGAIVRARRLPPDAEVSMGQCIGLRRRLPRVGDEHLGANLFITASKLTAASAGDWKTAAKAIRGAKDACTATAIGAELHRMAYSSDPARRWNMFFGSHHGLFTSWLHTGLHDLELGGLKPVWVQAAFRSLDGLVAALEDPEGGVNMQLLLDGETAARIVQDPAILAVWKA